MKSKQELTKSLNAENETDVLAAIEKFRTAGTESALPELIEVLIKNPGENVKNAVAHYI